MSMNKLGKKFSLAMGAALLMAGMQVGFAADANPNPQMKIAVVNVQTVLQQSARVAQISKQLESEFKARQQKINDEQKALQEALEKFKKESPTMSQNDRNNMQKKIAGDRAALVKQVVAYQQDVSKQQNKVMQSILADLNGVVSKIAKQDSYALVLDSQAVIYAINGNDITASVAKDFNEKK